MLHSPDTTSTDGTVTGKDTILVYVLYLVFLILAVLGMVMPDSFLWGVHILAFLPKTVSVGILILSVILAIPLISQRYVPIIAEKLIPPGKITVRRYVVIVLLSVAAGLIFYVGRTSIDMYGDAKTLLGVLADKNFTLYDIIRFNDYEPLTRYIHQKLSMITQIDQRETYQIVSSCTGALFVGILLWFATTAEGSPVWRLFLLITGMFCGTNQLFFGYIEDYTQVYLAMVVFLVLAWKYFDGKRTLPWLIVVFLIGIKLHIQMILFLPALCYLFVYRSSQKKLTLQRWLRPGVQFAGILLTMVILFGLYLFVFHAAHLDTGTNPEKMKKIFLPLFNYLPEPHQYSLFAPAHLIDIFQELLLAVAPGTLVVLFFSLIRSRSVEWFSPRIQFFSLAAFYFLIFDLTVDPLLTPMRDWDMLSLASAPVMFLGLALSKQLFEKDRRLSYAIVGVSLGLALLPAAFFYVNANRETAGERLRNLGVWSFNSYYAGSAYMVNIGCSLLQEKSEEISQREMIVHRLEPAASHPDLELGFLYHKLAVAEQSGRKYEPALLYYRKALEQDPYNASAVKGIAVVDLLTGHFDAAAREISRLNEGINAADVNDFAALQIAELAHRCSYLQYTGADTGKIRAEIVEAQKLFLH